MTSEGRWALQYLLRQPVALGHRLGYDRLREFPHGVWMREMLSGTRDLTLQAHRGSYKTTCLCIVLAVLAIACPPLFGAVMWLFAGIAVFVLVFALLLILHLKKLQRRASESFRQQQYYNEEGPAREGEVKVHRTTAAPQKKVKDDVGEYVDFEEEKQNDKQ